MEATEAPSPVTDTGLRLDFLAESDNIAFELEDDKLSEISDRVIREYEVDKASRKDWEEKIDAAMKIAMQVVEEKNYPWPKASNVKFPMMTTAAIQFAARSYPAIVPSSNVVKTKVFGSDEGVPAQDQNGQPAIDQETGEVLQWKIEPGAKRERGDRVATHMSWQLTEEMEEWEEDTDRLLHILPIVGILHRKTWYDPLLRRNRSEVCGPKDVVINYHAKSTQSAPRITHRIPVYPYEIEERIRGGIYRDFQYGVAPESTGDDDAPHWFLEQHRMLDLDGDGYPEPYIVEVHEETRECVRIVGRFDLDSILADREGNVVKIEPEHYFTKYGFIPSPDGSYYDVGFGVLLHPMNEAVNATLNQLLDAGHLQNTGGGFIGTGIRMKSGSLRFNGPGEYKKVEVAGGTLRENIVDLPFKGPSPVLFNLLGLLIDAGKEIASIKDVLLGQQEANQTATTTLALVEQGMKVFTSIYKRIHRSLKGELRLIYMLNKKYMPEEVYFTVLDDPKAVKQQDYETGSFDIVPVSDPSVVSDMQKMAKAEFLGQMQGQGLNDMEIKRRMLEAAGIDDIEKLFPPEDAPPPPELVAFEKEQARADEELRLKIKTAEDDSIRKDAELRLKSADTQAGIMQKMSMAQLNTNKAENEAGSFNQEVYLKEMDGLLELAKETVRDQSRGMARMETGADN